MTVKLQTEHALKESAQTRLSLHLSKCHIFANHINIGASIQETLLLLYINIQA